MNRINITDLIGIKYIPNGEDLDKGLFCFSFVQEVEKRFGRVFNLSTLISDNHFIETQSPEYGDVIVFYDSNKRGRHVGVYLEDERYIHCDAIGSHVSTLKDCSWNSWRFFTWLK